MKTNVHLEKIEKMIFSLPLQEQLELIEKIIGRLKEQNQRSYEEEVNLDEFYGIAKGLWHEDAQEYVNHLREDR